MGVTILEKLSEEQPSSRNASLEVVRELVRRHYSEIEEARARGYTWKQIDAVCRELWQSEGAYYVRWWRSVGMIESCFNEVKNGTTKGKVTPIEPLRFSVEVQKH